MQEQGHNIFSWKKIKYRTKNRNYFLLVLLLYPVLSKIKGNIYGQSYGQSCSQSYKILLAQKEKKTKKLSRETEVKIKWKYFTLQTYFWECVLRDTRKFRMNFSMWSMKYLKKKVELPTREAVLFLLWSVICLARRSNRFQLERFSWCRDVKEIYFTDIILKRSVNYEYFIHWFYL